MTGRCRQEGLFCIEFVARNDIDNQLLRLQMAARDTTVGLGVQPVQIPIRAEPNRLPRSDVLSGLRRVPYVQDFNGGVFHTVGDDMGQPSV